MAKGFRITKKWNKAVERIHKPFDKFLSSTLEGQVLAVRESTFLIHEIAVKSLQDNSDGKPQVRYKPKRVVNVSSPGDPPNTDTGRAVQSIKMDFKNSGLRGRVGTNLKYLRALEFGTKNISPRPWLSAAVKEAAKDVAEIFAKSIKKVIRDTDK